MLILHINVSITDILISAKICKTFQECRNLVNLGLVKADGFVVGDIHKKFKESFTLKVGKRHTIKIVLVKKPKLGEQACVQKTENCKIFQIRIGTYFHDGKGFSSFLVEGKGWRQVGRLPWDRPSIDKLISVCGAEDLVSCVNKLVRIERGSSGQIIALVHITNNKIRLTIEFSTELKYSTDSKLE